MNKVISILFVISFAINISAQSKYLIEANLGVGSSGFGLLSNILVDRILDVKVSPVMLVDIQLYPTSKVALGGGLSFQSFNYGLITDSNKISFDLKKLNLSIYGRYYYVNTNKLAIYTHLRAGYSFWFFSLNSSILDFIESYKFLFNFLPINLEQPNEGNFRLMSLQLTLIGFKKQVTNNLGVYSELSIGSPYWLLGGISYKLAPSR